MLNLGSKVWGWIVGVAGLLAAGLSLYLKGRSAGKQAEKGKAVEARLEAEIERSKTVEQAVKVENSVGSLPASDVTKRLQDRWSRD